MADLTPYATAKPFFGIKPTWLTQEDADRIQAYQLYESIYKNVPDAFKVIQRGTDQNPIYIPSAKTIIDASTRFLAKNWDYALSPRVGTDADREAMSTFLTNLFIREEMLSKFATQKKYGLIRGDAIWHITADPLKEPGKRLSIHEIDPASYFPIFDPVHDTKVIGCHLVDQFPNSQGQTIIRRQTYRKDSVTKRISFDISWWEIAGWDDREGSGQELKRTAPPAGFVGQPAYELPTQITSIPVYHVKNDREPDSPFGVSELQGMERVIAGINQAISDEELSLALDGLGVYATTSGPPVDEDGEETNWVVGPGTVVEIDEDSTFERIDGIRTVAPMQDHIAYLEKKLKEASGTSDAAIGKVDASIAESGISLRLQLAPIIAKNQEREQQLLSKIDHMLYDITTMWMPAYEGLSIDAVALSITDDAMPVNRKEVLEEVSIMLTSNLISIAYAQQYVSEKLGYDFPAEMLEAIVTEQTNLATARNADPFSLRVQRELDGA